MSLPGSGSWVPEYYPTFACVERDGRLVVDLPVRSEAFLARILLRVGAEARVLSPPGWADVGRRAAGELARLYSTNVA